MSPFRSIKTGTAETLAEDFSYLDTNSHIVACQRTGGIPVEFLGGLRSHAKVSTEPALSPRYNTRPFRNRSTLKARARIARASWGLTPVCLSVCLLLSGMKFQGAPCSGAFQNSRLWRREQHRHPPGVDDVERIGVI